MSTHCCEYCQSKATQELDDLMQSIQEFAVRDSSQAQLPDGLPLAPTLSPRPRKQAPGVCAMCEGVIKEVQLVTAMGMDFHKEHFACVACHTNLAGAMFFNHQDSPYCSPCYHRDNSPKCGYCTEPIVDVSKEQSEHLRVYV